MAIMFNYVNGGGAMPGFDLDSSQKDVVAVPGPCRGPPVRARSQRRPSRCVPRRDRLIMKLALCATLLAAGVFGASLFLQTSLRESGHNASTGGPVAPEGKP